MMKTGQNCSVFNFLLYRKKEIGYNKPKCKLKEMRAEDP